jgi:hypothetical protein
MGASRSASETGLALLKAVVKRPLDFGLDSRHGSLKNILEFTIRHPRCVRDASASASRKIKRSLERSRHTESEPAHIQRRIGRQLLQVKEGLAWTDLDHRLNIASSDWNLGLYSRLAQSLSVLAALCRYRRRCISKVPLKPVNEVAARVACLKQRKGRGWKAVHDYVVRCGIDWQADVAAHLGDTTKTSNVSSRGTEKVVRRDQDGNTWMVKYSPESLVNPVLASIFARLSGCPGAEICPSFLDYDPRHQRPCSVQPYISAKPVRRYECHSETELIRLIGGSRRRASQMLCQAVGQWILENIDGNQLIIDEFGNVVSIDHDRSFFIDEHRVVTDFQAALEARRKTAVSAISRELIKVAARIPGVMEDLAEFVARVEAIPAPVYEGLVRNATFREEQLCSLYYLDTMSAGALGSVKALEDWIAHLLARKQTVRATLAQRLREVLGGTKRYLQNKSVARAGRTRR